MLSNLIDVCIVPHLLHDVEDNPMTRESYAEYANNLDINAKFLLDHLSNNYTSCEDITTRLKLILLMCQHAPILPNEYPLYSSSDPSVFWSNLARLCSTDMTSAPLLTQCLAVYQEKLADKKWRMDIGSAYGFVYFCGVYLKGQSTDTDHRSMLYILSMASQFIDCIHGEIKLLGLRLYELILAHCPPGEIVKANVHRVVIRSCLDNCQKLLPNDCLLLLWKVIADSVCLPGGQIIDDLSWNELDRSLQQLFQKIKLEGSREIRQNLRSILKRMIVECYGGEQEAKNDLEGSDVLVTQQKILRKKKKNIKIFRWITDLKELYLFECLSISNSSSTTDEALSFIIETYLLTMCGPLKEIESTLDDLTKRLTPMLLEIYNIFRECPQITRKIVQILHLLLENLNAIRGSAAHPNHHVALSKLLMTHLPHPLSIIQ